MVSTKLIDRDRNLCIAFRARMQIQVYYFFSYYIFRASRECVRTQNTRHTHTHTYQNHRWVGERYPKRESSLFYGSSHSGISGALDSIMCVEYWETYCRRRVIGTHSFGCYQRNVISKPCVVLSDLLLFGVRVNLMCWDKKTNKIVTHDSQVICIVFNRRVLLTCFYHVGELKAFPSLMPLRTVLNG